jgi:4-amino-4-deoxy-L-arabinose transferase-like glycosyltransferase
MKHQSANTWRDTLGIILLPVILSLIFLVFTYLYYPFRIKLQFDTDEGLNLMRSMLVVKGYSLYGEISSDQPPLFTYILAGLLRITGFEVNPARFLVLLFSTSLVWAGAQFAQLTWGKPTAILFLPIIMIVPYYPVLSVSVMIGIPSIALAVISMLFVILWHEHKRDIWLVLSAFFLALSVLIKLFTGFLALIFLIGITIAAYLDGREEEPSWKILRPAWTWGICFTITGLTLGGTLIGPGNMGALILPSVEASSQAVFQSNNFTLNAQLQNALPLLALGSLGTFVSIYRRKWFAFYPLAWSIVAYSLFSFYSPVFYHHQLLITVPAAMLASSFVGEGISFLGQRRQPSGLVWFQSLLGMGALVGFLLVFNHYYPAVNKELSKQPSISQSGLSATSGKIQILRAMNDYADQTNWIVTDMPIYAFRVHKPVPPILATFSQKRLATGSLTEENVLKAMLEYHPEQVLMARFNIPALEFYLSENYTLVSQKEFFRLFIRNDLAPQVK